MGTVSFSSEDVCHCASNEHYMKIWAKDPRCLLGKSRETVSLRPRLCARGFTAETTETVVSLVERINLKRTDCVHGFHCRNYGDRRELSKENQSETHRLCARSCTVETRETVVSLVKRIKLKHQDCVHGVLVQQLGRLSEENQSQTPNEMHRSVKCPCCCIFPVSYCIVWREMELEAFVFQGFLFKFFFFVILCLLLFLVIVGGPDRRVVQQGERLKEKD